jgi:hypothetical protein
LEEETLNEFINSLDSMDLAYSSITLNHEMEEFNFGLYPSMLEKYQDKDKNDIQKLNSKDYSMWSRKSEGINALQRQNICPSMTSIMICSIIS